MGVMYGNSGSESLDMSVLGPLVYPITAHSCAAGAGSDTVYGSAYKDFIHGEDGHDLLFGNGGDDFITGGNGFDELQGGSGSDSLYGEAGNDILWGGSGADFMSGGDGNDTYYHFRGDGIDRINDNQYSNGSQGAGSGNDTIRMGYSSSEVLLFTQLGDNHLYISTYADIYDGYFDEGLVIENFFLNGNYVVELLITSDNLHIDLTAFL